LVHPTRSTVDITDIAVRLHPDSSRATAVSKLFQVCVFNGTDSGRAEEINKVAKVRQLQHPFT